MPAVNWARPPKKSAGPIQTDSGMKLALLPLSRNVVSAKAASPNGAGSAAGMLSTSVVGRSWVRTAMLGCPPSRRRRKSPRPSVGLRSIWAAITRIAAGYSGFEVIRVIRDDLGAVLGHEHDVLEANAPVSGPVEAGLDCHHVTRNERLVRQAAHARCLVYFEADAVAEPMEEAVGERLAGLLRPLCRLARRLEDVACDAEDGAGLDAGANLGDRRVERLLAQPVPFAHVLGHVAHNEGARHVRVERGGVVAREDVDHERRAGPYWSRAHVVTDRALRPGGDDVLVGRRVVNREDDVHVRLHALDGELLAVEQQLGAADLRAPEELSARVHGRLRRSLRPSHPRELSLGLGATALGEEIPVDGELDAVGPAPVREPDREVLRHARPFQPEDGDGPQRELRVELGRVDPGRDQLVDAELVVGMDLEEP